MSVRKNADGGALAARLKHRAVIEQFVATSDEIGGAQGSWQEVATVWAELVALNAGDERLIAGALQAENRYRMVMRYRADIDAAMRVVVNGRYFNIRRIVNIDEANVVLELLLEAGVAL